MNFQPLAALLVRQRRSAHRCKRGNGRAAALSARHGADVRLLYQRAADHLLARDDPHEQLFELLPSHIVSPGARKPIMRHAALFEKTPVQQLGYALALEREAGNGEPIRQEVSIVTLLNAGRCRDDGNMQTGLPVLARPCSTWRQTTMPIRLPRSRASN